MPVQPSDASHVHGGDTERGQVTATRFGGRPILPFWTTSSARRQRAFNVRLMVGRWFVERAWIGPRCAAVPVVSGIRPNSRTGHW